MREKTHYNESWGAPATDRMAMRNACGQEITGKSRSLTIYAVAQYAGSQEFDRHSAIKLKLGSGIDFSHAAAREWPGHAQITWSFS